MLVLIVLVSTPAQGQDLPMPVVVFDCVRVILLRVLAVSIRIVLVVVCIGCLTAMRCCFDRLFVLIVYGWRDLPLVLIVYGWRDLPLCLAVES